MNKKLKTTTKNIIIKLLIFAAAVAIVILTILGIFKTEDGSLQHNINNKDIIIKDQEIEERPSKIADTIYCTVAGDSYSKISKMFYDVEELCWALMEWNGADENSILQIGQEIRIPSLNNEEFVSVIKKVNKLMQIPKTVKNESVVTEIYPIQEEQSKVTNKYSAPTTPGPVKNNPGYVDTSNFTYLGPYRITGYTPGCVHCCGNNKGITASTAPAIIGRTIATTKDFDFGTMLYIKGYGFYIVEDRGAFGSGIIDMAAGSHQECDSITKSGVDVYLVPNN